MGVKDGPEFKINITSTWTLKFYLYHMIWMKAVVNGIGGNFIEIGCKNNSWTIRIMIWQVIKHRKKFLHLVQSENVISHEAPGKEGKWKYPADLDVS